MLRRICAGELDNDVRLKAVVLGRICDEFSSFVHCHPLDAETIWNHHRLYEYLKRAESLVLGLRQVNLRWLGALIGNICDVRVAPEGLWG